MIKKLPVLLLFLILIYSNYSRAQVSLTATSGTLTGTFSTLKGAFDAINAGTHQGSIAITVTANTSETATATLNASGSGSASYTHISIMPSGTRTIGGLLTTPIISLSGASSVTFDGLNIGGNSLTIQNINSGSTLEFINDASNDTIQNTTLLGTCTSATAGILVFSTSTATTGNDNNIITGCTFRNSSSFPVWQVYGLGTAGKTNSGNKITNCNFENFYCRPTFSGGAISIADFNDNMTISDNHFYWTANKTGIAGRSISAINISNTSATGMIISGNYIGGGSRFCGGAALTTNISVSTVTCTFYGIFFNTASASSSCVVSKNKIGNIIWRSAATSSTTPGVWTGIYSTTTNALIGGNLGDGNIIGTSNGSDSIIVELSSTSANILVAGIDMAALSPTEITATLKNNIIGGITINSITAGGVAATTSGAIFRGIGIATSTELITIDSNIIGNGTANNIKYGSILTSTTTNNIQYGIYNASATNLIVTNNIIQNFTNNYAPSSAINISQIKGISMVTGSHIITGNIIRNLTASANSFGYLTNASVIGISAGSTLVAHTSDIETNRIYNLSNTNISTIGQVSGIVSNMVSTSGNLIARNLISCLVTASTGSALIGIFVSKGTVETRNNMVRLGLVPNGTSLSISAKIIGIKDSSGCKSSIFNNSIHIGGATTGTENTYCYFNDLLTSTHDIRNNIFSNVRTNGGAGKNYLVSTSVGPNLTLNYNNYFVLNNTAILCSTGGVDYTTGRAWREALSTSNGMDTNSFIRNPQFTGANSDTSVAGLNISTSLTVALEGVGVSIPSVTDDYDGDLRSSFSPEDVGADAGNFLFINTDPFQPNITYTPLGNTSAPYNRLSTISVTDIGGFVYRDSTTNGPRVWYRRSLPTSTSWVSSPCLLASGNLINGTWNYIIDYSRIGVTPVIGETYEYYFVAMDSTANNVWYSPFVSASHTSPGAAGTAPSNPNSYTIITGLSGNVSVNSSNVANGTTLFTSLTGAAPGGLFASINASRLRGNITATISSNLSEPGTIALNEFIADSVNSILKIQGDGTLRTISNAVDITQQLIRFNGADRVVIDGGPGQKLLFRNTHATSFSCYSTILFDNTSINDTLRNCILESNSTRFVSLRTGGVISVYLNGTNNVYIGTNKIRGSTGGTIGQPIYGVIISDSSTVNLVGNEIYNDSLYGVYLEAVVSGSLISGNSFYFSASTATASWYGIYTSSPCTITGNYIGGSSASCGSTALVFSAGTSYISGIYVSSTSTITPVSIFNNIIQNISLTGTTSCQFFGINIVSGMVQIGSSSGNGNLIGHASTLNSISIGTATALSICYGIFSSSTVLATNSYSSNIIANLTIPSTNTGSSFLSGINLSSSLGSFNDSIINNTIYNLLSSAGKTGFVSLESISGIHYYGTVKNVYIQNNTIFGLSELGTATISSKVEGIFFGGGSANSFIKQNRIYNLFNNMPSGSIDGILSFSSNAITISNNQISLNNDLVTNNVTVIGLVDYNTGASNAKYYYNSVYIGGTLTALAVNFSSCYYKSNGSLSDLKNNLFYNERTGGTSSLGNISITGASTGTWSSNYNLLVTPNLSQVGNWNYSFTGNFTSFKSSSGQDANSMYETVAKIPADSIFTNKGIGDLSIPSNSRHSWYVNGTGIPINGFADDFNTNSVRSTSIANGASDIGSDEVVLTAYPALSTMTLVSGTISNGSTQVYNFGSRQFLNITWYGTGLPTSAVVSYLPGSYNMVFCTGKNQGDAYFLVEPSGGTGNPLTDWYYNITMYYDEATLRNLNEGTTNFGLAKRTYAGNCSDWQVFDTTNCGSPTNFFVDYTSNFIGRREFHNFGLFGISDKIAPLPIKLVSFKALLRGETAELNWHTALEINNDRFEIERSNDGIHYDKIGESKGHLTSYQVNHYSYLDSKPIFCTTYYRLKQVNLDETFEYSNVTTVTPPLITNSIAVFPNPSKNKLTIQFVALKNQEANLYIYTTQGVLVGSKPIVCIKGKNSASIDIQDLPAGYYILKLALEEINYSTQILH